MTLHAFNHLPIMHPLAAVYATGTLATRWQAQHEAVNRSELPRYYFVEVTYDRALNTVITLLSFDRYGPPCW